MRGAFVLAALLAAVASAQEQVVVHADGDRQIVTVQIANFVGTRPGGLGFLVVDVQNLDSRPHRFDLDASTPPWAGGDVATTVSTTLGPLERTKFFLPRPNSRLGNPELDVRIDNVQHLTSTAVGGGNGLAGLVLGDRAEVQSWATLVMQALPTVASDAPAVQWARPEHFHDDWRLFTGFDAVLVDGRCAVPERTQEALRRFVFAGGLVVVADADRLPPGALRTLATTTLQPHLHGLGRCVVVSRPGGDTTQLAAQLADVPRAGLEGWPAAPAFFTTLPIPGLGSAPALVFLAIVLAFAIAAGPVNFWLLRKWKRPLLVLATVPALGLGTTALMLGYGLVNDGLGVRGVARSVTLLDQERHEAASLTMRTLFCGFSPSALTMSADSFVLAPRAFEHDQFRDPDRWHLDATTQQLDGGALPSRRPTPLLSAQQGTARQRLRMRVVDADHVELLADGGVAPIGVVLVHDFDGTWWSGNAPQLQRVAPDAAKRELESRLGEVAVMPTWTRERYDGEMLVDQVHATIARFLVGGQMPRGSYLAQVGDVPWIDEHGLDVAYDLRQHFVFGRFAAEDVVR